MNRINLNFLFVLLLTIFVGACGNEDSDLPANKTAELRATSATLSQAEEMRLKRLVADYWQNTRSEIEATQRKVSALQEVVGDFLLSPTTGSHAEVKEAWIQAYLSYQHLNVVSMFAKAAPNSFAGQANIWLAIDPFPIAPGFIDDIGPYKSIGLVNDSSLALSEAAVRSQHALTHESEAVLGFLPMAFLLWGDKSDSEERLEKFNPTSDLKSVVRRRQLLELNSLALVNDVSVLQQWLADTGPIDVSFYRLPVMAQIELVRQSTLLNLEQRILAVLRDQQMENWRPASVWSQIIESQLKQLIVQLDFLQACGLQFDQKANVLREFVVSRSGVEPVDEDRDTAQLDSLSNLSNLSRELEAVYLSLSKSQ